MISYRGLTEKCGEIRQKIRVS